MTDYSQLYDEVRESLDTAFLDETVQSDPAYRPEFISNSRRRGRNVYEEIEWELRSCDSFDISVAFISLSGIEPFLMVLKELEKKHIPGRVLTTNYLYFSEPAALDKLHSLHNIELRMYRTDFNSRHGFHTKGYIFHEKGLVRIIIGSANLTASALKVNKEWNTRLVGSQNGEAVNSILDEFDDLWKEEESQPYKVFIEDYRRAYQQMHDQRAAFRPSGEMPAPVISPNKMQRAVVENVRKLYMKKASRGLLISATGTGKTYASAFAVREMHAEKVLFLVHREQIAQQALRSYQRVFGRKAADGSSLQYAVLSGRNSHEVEKIRSADLIFATMQTMTKENILHAFHPSEFDVIVIDEAHHAGARSYQNIMQYFHPAFWFGMTASPDTDRYDIYKEFDHNIIYEIRLQQAMEEDLLCPFHYFGVADYTAGDRLVQYHEDAAGISEAQLASLTSEERAKNILAQSRYYGSSGSRIKGIVFCSHVREAEALSEQFNRCGCRTAVLTGKSSQERRKEVLDQLAREVPADMRNRRMNYLDYVFTVDVLSEGVDVPEINQVIMLRPTQSAVVFVQQLGRGLRKAENKEFVVILDFIGNYQGNFLIPIALSGDRSYNKDNIRRYLQAGSRLVPGLSTIHFDAVSQKKIYETIDKANFNELRLLKDSYRDLKLKIGRIPSLADFEAYGSIDVCRFFDNPRLGSYDAFLEKYEPEYPVRLNPVQAHMLKYVSQKFGAGKRRQELFFLRLVLNSSGWENLAEKFRELWYYETGNTAEDTMVRTVMNQFDNSFAVGTGRNTFADCQFIQGNFVHPAFAEERKDPDFRRLLEEVIDFALGRWKTYFAKPYQGTDFCLNRKYTYEEVCRLLNWEQNVVPGNIGGYWYDEKTHTLPVFINYDKPEDIKDSINYPDRFLSEDTLIALSKSGKTIQSPDVQRFLHAGQLGIRVHLFVRKNKDDQISKEFYYLGEMDAAGKAEEIQMPKTHQKAVEITWKLRNPVSYEIYHYLMED
jgi:superfamily II DNA or RNA helicase/HKD family nuclease